MYVCYLKKKFQKMFKIYKSKNRHFPVIPNPKSCWDTCTVQVSQRIPVQVSTGLPTHECMLFKKKFQKMLKILQVQNSRFTAQFIPFLRKQMQGHICMYVQVSTGPPTHVCMLLKKFQKNVHVQLHTISKRNDKMYYLSTYLYLK
jgi:hypothetical protein